MERRAATAVAPLVNITTSKPMELVTLDYLTIIEEPPGKVTNLLIAVDDFVKYAWAIPTRNQKANTTARAIWEKIILQFGFMDKIHSDQGKAFQSALFKALCKLGK